MCSLQWAGLPHALHVVIFFFSSNLTRAPFFFYYVAFVKPQMQLFMGFLDTFL